LKHDTNNLIIQLDKSFLRLKELQVMNLILILWNVIHKNFL